MAVQSVYGLANILRAFGGNYEESIPRIDDCDVVQADGGDRPRRSDDDASVAVDENRLPLGNVAVCIFLAHFRKGGVRADVAPAEVTRNAHDAIGVLHDSVVDGDSLRSRKMPRQ